MINSRSRVHMSTLPDHIQQDIRSYADANPGNDDCSIPEDETLTLRQVLDRYLGWHGIHGYTHGICAIVSEAIDEEDE